MKRLFSFLIVILLSSCSQGSFDDNRNYFQSLYGLSPLPLGLTGASFVGRIVDEEGREIPFARIYVKGSPLYTTSNQKGGFLLSGLQGERSTVFISSSQGLGRTLELDLKDGQLLEDPRIVLMRHVRLSGRVLSGAAAVTDARVSIEGSPFSTFSDSEGHYILELPAGLYPLKAEHLLYNPYKEDALIIDQDLVRDLSLEPLGMPSVQIIVDKAEGPIVRGLVTTLRFDRSANVRYMRVISHSQNFKDAAELPSTWVPATDSLVLQHKGPGSSRLIFQFMDQFGKMTDPIDVSYYNSLYDASWRLIHGQISEPILIRRHEKVAFLGHHYWAETVPGSSISAPPSAPGTVGPGLSTIISAPVEVEAGATLHGSAQFNRSLRLRGTAEHPISWDLRGESGSLGTVWLRSNEGEIQESQIQGGQLVFDPSLVGEDREGLWMFQAARFQDVELTLHRSYALDALRFDFASCAFQRSQLSIFSLGYGSNSGSSEPVPAESPRIRLLPQLSLHVAGGRFQDSTLRVEEDVPAREGDSLRIQLDGNNFLGLPPQGYYLRLPASILAQGQKVQLEAGENYFEHEAFIISNLGAWTPYLGKRRETPFP